MSDRKAVKTAAKAVIIENGRVLLLQKRSDDGIFHVLPGGKQQHGESLTAAVQRECREELDIDIQVGELLIIREYIGRNHEFATTHWNLHKVEFFFACMRCSGSEPGRGDIPDETQEGFVWLPLDDLRTVRFFPRTIAQPLQEFGRGEHFPCRYVGDTN